MVIRGEYCPVTESEGKAKEEVKRRTLTGRGVRAREMNYLFFITSVTCLIRSRSSRTSEHPSWRPQGTQSAREASC